MSFSSCTENCHSLHSFLLNEAPNVFEKRIQTFNSRPGGTVPIVWYGILQVIPAWVATAFKSGIVRRERLQDLLLRRAMPLEQYLLH